MMALSTQCVHPETQKSYIKGITGGKNNSTEPVRVSVSLRLCSKLSPSAAT